MSDGCLTTCDRAACGDGFVHTGVEECDDLLDVDCRECVLGGDNPCGPEAELEPNDDMGSAQFVCDGSVVSGGFDLAGDDDWFAVIVQAGQTLTVETSDGAAACPGDTLVFFYASDATPTEVVAECIDEVDDLGCDDDLGFSTCSLLSHVAAVDDIVFVRVVAYGDASAFDYAVSVTVN
jgi:hypothetical protein